MSNFEKQIEREEEELFNMLEEGIISQQEYDRELNALHREARAAMEELAQAAYDDVMRGGW